MSDQARASSVSVRNAPGREDMKAPDYFVAFSGQSKSYCVGLADLVEPTQITSSTDPAKMSRYYEIFMNSMSQTVSRFGGSVVKSVGDGIWYYFPESSKPNRKFGFLACLECNLAMCEARKAICQRLEEEGLPCLDLRVSSDYGQVVMFNVNNSSLPDMIGPPLNMCAKINPLAPPNGVVVGGDLHEMVKNFDEYSFKALKGFSIGLKLSYAVYSVSRKQ